VNRITERNWLERILQSRSREGLPDDFFFDDEAVYFRSIVILSRQNRKIAGLAPFFSKLNSYAVTTNTLSAFRITHIDYAQDSSRLRASGRCLNLNFCTQL